MSKNHARFLIAGALLLGANLARADAVYTGAAAAQFSSPETGLVFDNDRGTTAVPAAYLAARGGAMATSLSGAADGGSVASTALGSGGGDDGALGVASASTQLDYRVTLVPLPGASLTAPISIHAFGVGSALVSNAGGLSTATMSASTYLTLDLENGQALIEGYDYADSAKPLGSFVVDTIFTLLPGQFFDVGLLAIASAGGSAYAQASSDPVFTIDAAYAAFYQLVGIPAVDVVTPPGQTPPTAGLPEPSTWLLFAIGVAALLSFGRKRGVESGWPSVLAQAAARRYVLRPAALAW